MEMYPEQFPAERRPDPSRRAEDRVFDADQDCDRPGFILYEELPYLDFVIRTQSGGRFLLQIKGVR